MSWKEKKKELSLPPTKENLERLHTFLGKRFDTYSWRGGEYVKDSVKEMLLADPLYRVLAYWECAQRRSGLSVFTFSGVFQEHPKELLRDLGKFNMDYCGATKLPIYYGAGQLLPPGNFTPGYYPEAIDLEAKLVELFGDKWRKISRHFQRADTSTSGHLADYEWQALREAGWLKAFPLKTPEYRRERAWLEKADLEFQKTWEPYQDEDYY